MTSEEREIRDLLFKHGFQGAGSSVISNYALNLWKDQEGRTVLIGCPSYYALNTGLQLLEESFRVYLPHVVSETTKREEVVRLEAWLDDLTKDRGKKERIQTNRDKLDAYPVLVTPRKSGKFDGFEARYAPLEDRLTGWGYTKGEAVWALESESDGFLEAIEAAGETLPDPPCEKETETRKEEAP